MFHKSLLLIPILVCGGVLGGCAHHRAPIRHGVEDHVARRAIVHHLHRSRGQMLRRRYHRPMYYRRGYQRQGYRNQGYREQSQQDYRQPARQQSAWRNGMPSIFARSSYWIGDFQPATDATKDDEYNRVMTTLSSNSSFNPTNITYNAKKQYQGSGADESATAGIHPHFKSLGNGMYLIAGGADSLNDELNNKSDNHGNVSLVKVLDNNHIQIWTYDNNHMNRPYTSVSKQYMGKFTRYPRNDALIRRVLGMK